MFRRTRLAVTVLASAAVAALTASLHAAVGDPQLKTDHPWYPGELACSTFDRLFATQRALYKRVTGRDTNTDEDKALASWLWRNTHYAHAEEGRQDCFSAGFDKAEWNRDYWTGLFAHGFGLCGTTHAQWTAEMNALLGHGRGRVVGVSGHNSFEVYLTGGAYGAGRWALLDHDVSTIVFAPDGSRLLSIQEVSQNLHQLTDPAFKPERQHGWRIGGLHDEDFKAFDSFRSAEYLAGYAGPPPAVHLRAGESLRRYFEPGLDDGQTFVYWGMNYATAGVPGLERSRTWVNQPEKMFGSKGGAGHKPGLARYGNAVYEYAPDFTAAAYKQAVVDAGPGHVTFEFRTPCVIAATPAASTPAAGKATAGDKWSVYKPGATNGLVVHGSAGCGVRVSVDGGQTWHDGGTLNASLDLTDQVKGHHQYLLRFDAPAAALAGKGVRWRTVCQANPATFPRLRGGENRITYHASGIGLTSAGPSKAQAEARVVAGAMGSRSVTLELTAPRGERPVRVYAAGWLNTGNPPDTKAVTQIELSADGGKTWTPVVKDWRVVRRDPEPADFWSQSFAWGEAAVPPGAAGPAGTSGPVRVRFTHGGKPFRKVEAHLAYAAADPQPAEVTFAWTERDGQTKTASHTYPATTGLDDATWTFRTGDAPRTRWVEVRAK